MSNIIDLRKVFFDTLLELARKDKKIICIVGDLGFSFCEQFKKELPKQFLNAGCIEQSIVGIAAGMALAGLNPYVYSCAPFLVFRAYEQIRDDVCYNNLNVKIVGTGADGFLGFSHNLNPIDEDIKTLKHLPNLKISWPKTKKKLRYMLKKSVLNNNPQYFKL